MLIVIVCYIAIFILFFYFQNSGSKIGGAITVAKTYWLALALFSYYVLPFYGLLYSIGYSSTYTALKVVLNVFIIRLIVQGIMMYVTKNWSPAFGITFNGIGILSLVITSYVLFTYKEMDQVTILLVLYMIYCLLLDSYYAMTFANIVGDRTKGDKAIWFAGEQEEFKNVNRITRINNFILTMFLVILLYKLKTLW